MILFIRERKQLLLQNLQEKSLGKILINKKNKNKNKNESKRKPKSKFAVEADIKNLKLRMEKTKKAKFNNKSIITKTDLVDESFKNKSSNEMIK